MSNFGSQMLTLEKSSELERPPAAECTAELAECTCPEFCERDHELD